MIRGLYTAATAMVAEQVRNDVAANNLANVNTTGFKRDFPVLSSFPEMLLARVNDTGPAGVSATDIGTLGTGVTVDAIVTDHGPGELRQTGRNMDLAIEGDGYFAIRTPQGERYTRNGVFKIGEGGIIVTPEGYEVLGRQGPLRMTGPNIQIDSEGKVLSEGKLVDYLKIVSFDDTNALEKIGNNLFAGGQPRNVAIDGVRQGFLESSNVDSVTEMVNIITILRSYEASQKVISSQDSLLGKAVNEVGRV